MKFPFAMCAVFLLMAGCKGGTTKEPVFIGHLAPFSGPQKVIGEHARQAITLAVEEVNKDEKNSLGRPIKVLHPEYPPGEADKLQPVALRLIDVNKVAALMGAVELNEVNELERAALPYDVPLVVFAGLPPDLAGDNVFSVNASLSFQAQTLAQYAKQELKADRAVVLVDVRRMSCTTLADLFEKEFAKAGAAWEFSYKTAGDFSELMERVKKAQPGVIVHAGAVAELGGLRDRLQATGIKTPLIFAGDLSLLDTDREASNGVYVATPYAASNPSKQNQDFVKKYKDRFNRLPDLNAGLAYDGMRVLFQAMRRANSFERLKIEAALTEMTATPFETSLSGSWTFDKNHAARRPLYAGKIEDGRLVNFKEYAQEAK